MPRFFISLCFIILYVQVNAQPKTKAAKNKQQQDSLKTINTDTFVCRLPETWAEFPGGYVAIKSYLAKNSQDLYKEAGKNDTYGKIFIKFIITDKGIIDSVKVLKGLKDCKACDEEALKIIINMPKWKPATFQNVNVKSWYTLPISVVPN